MKKLKNKVVSLAVLVCLLASPVSVSAQSSSREKADLVISSARQWNEFAAKVSGGNDFTGKLIKLSKDIEFDDSTLLNFSPAGQKENDRGFNGTFDACGHTISNVLYAESDDYKFAAMFGTLKEQGIIKNLTIKDSKFISEYWSAAFTPNNYGLISNCHNINSETNSGGIVVCNGGTIVDCSNTGNVSGNSLIGGIAGKNTGAGRIYNCYNVGKISGKIGRVGGITGESYKGSDGSISKIINCYNIGLVTSESGPVGGISGEDHMGIFRNCYYDENTALQAFNYRVPNDANLTVETNVRSMTLAEMETQDFADELNENRGSDTTWQKWEYTDGTPTFAPLYEVTFKTVKNGYAKTDFSYANQGQKVTITLVPNRNYKASSLAVTTVDNKKVAVYKKNTAGTKYTFTMPDGDVIVNAKMKKR